MSIQPELERWSPRLLVALGGITWGLAAWKAGLALEPLLDAAPAALRWLPVDRLAITACGAAGLSAAVLGLASPRQRRGACVARAVVLVGLVPLPAGRPSPPSDQFPVPRSIVSQIK